MNVRKLLPALIVGAVALAPPAAIQAQPAGSAVVRLSSLHMLTPTTGWAQAGCRILHTVAGPERWTDVTPAGVRCSGPNNGNGPVAYFLGAGKAWLARAMTPAAPAGKAVVWRTRDGGHSWQRSVLAALPGTQGVISLFALNPRRVWIMISAGVGMGQEQYGLFGSTNGGRGWTRLTVAGVAAREELPACDCPVGVAFASSTSGWVTGNYFALSRLFLFHTADGGRTWQHRSLSLPAGIDPMGVRIDPPDFFGADAGVLPVRLSVNRFVLYRTHDAGVHWTRTSALAVSSAIGVYYSLASRYEAWVSDGSRLYHTSDGGWHWQAIVPNHPIRGPLDFLSPRLGFGLDQSPPLSDRSALWRTSDGGHTWVRLSPVIVGRG